MDERIQKLLEYRNILAAAVIASLIILFLALLPGTLSEENNYRTVTVDSERYPFYLGKIDYPNTLLESNQLSVRKGSEKVDYWESLTFDLVKVSRLEAETDIPEGDSANVSLKSSTNPDFKLNGSYHAPNSLTWKLEDGNNIINITKGENENLTRYVRVHFSLVNSASDDRPVVKSFSLTGKHDSRDLLVAHD